MGYTPEELDAYLATKDWACETLADKRQATLMLLNADNLLTPEAIAYVASLTVAVQVSGNPNDYLPVVCLTHSTSLSAFKYILQRGMLMPDRSLRQKRTDQYPGVYMTPYLQTSTHLVRHSGMTLVFSSTLLGRSDFHFNMNDQNGLINRRTLSQPTMGQLDPRKVHPLAEVVFHHPVRVSTADRLIGIWISDVTLKYVRDAITTAGREDLLNLVMIIRVGSRTPFTSAMVRDHVWTEPLEPQNANFCTPFVDLRQTASNKQSLDLLAKIAVNCGRTPDKVDKLIKRKCTSAEDCIKRLTDVVIHDSTAMLDGTLVESPTTYYPPLQDAPLVGVHIPSRYTPLQS